MMSLFCRRSFKATPVTPDDELDLDCEATDRQRNGASRNPK